jgi:ubiquinone/menaquinone biosynthesis C-methylase UbiE
MPEDHSTSTSTNDLRTRFLTFAFQQLYGPFAWAYDWVSRTFFLGQWRVWQRTAIPHLLGPDVLEIGMGTGDLQFDLLKAGFIARGVDLSPQMVRKARRKARRLGAALSISRARAQALPFSASTFNSVVSTFPSDYIVDPRTLSEVARVLRPGGRLVIVPGGWLQRRDAKGKAMEGVARLVYGHRDDPPPADLAKQIVSRPGRFKWVSALKARMSAAGFTLSMRVASNAHGSCLIIIADKRDSGVRC